MVGLASCFIDWLVDFALFYFGHLLCMHFVLCSLCMCLDSEGKCVGFEKELQKLVQDKVSLL